MPSLSEFEGPDQHGVENEAGEKGLSSDEIKKEILPLLTYLHSDCTAEYREEDKVPFSKEALASKFRLEWFSNVLCLIKLVLPKVKEPLRRILNSYHEDAFITIRASMSEPRTLEEVMKADQMLAMLIAHIEAEM